jgi:hypothetical protein
MLYEKKILSIFCECESNIFLYSMFLANAKSNLGPFFGYFMEFFKFSGKMVVFLCESALENKIFALQNWTVPFRIRKAFVYLRYIGHQQRTPRLSPSALGKRTEFFFKISNC